MKNFTDIFGSRLNTAKQKLSKLEMGINCSTQRRKNSNTKGRRNKERQNFKR